MLFSNGFKQSDWCRKWSYQTLIKTYLGIWKHKIIVSSLWQGTDHFICIHTIRWDKPDIYILRIISAGIILFRLVCECNIMSPIMRNREKIKNNCGVIQWDLILEAQLVRSRKLCRIIFQVKVRTLCWPIRTNNSCFITVFVNNSNNIWPGVVVH